MRDRIIEKLKKSGDWGEFSRCRFRRLIQRDNRAEYYPTTKEEAQNSGKVERRGQGNSSRQPSNYRTKKFRFNFKEILPAFPQNYRLVKQELDFYKNTNFRFRANASFPAHGPFEMRTPYKSFDRACTKCEENFIQLLWKDRKKSTVANVISKPSIKNLNSTTR